MHMTLRIKANWQPYQERNPPQASLRSGWKMSWMCFTSHIFKTEKVEKIPKTIFTENATIHCSYAVKIQKFVVDHELCRADEIIKIVEHGRVSLH